MSLPDSSVLGPSSDTPALYFKLSQEAVDAILATNGKGVKLRISDGSNNQAKIDLQIRDQSSFNVSPINEAQHIDLYKNNSGRFDCIGKVESRLSVKQTIGTVSASSSASRLKSQSDNLQQEKEAKKATLLSGSGDIKRSGSSSAVRTPPYSRLQHEQSASANGSKSTPTSPAMNGSKKSSSQLASTNTTTTTTTTTTNNTTASSNLLPSKPISQLPLNSAPLRIIHYLAVSGKTPLKVISQRTGSSMNETQAVLTEIGTKFSDGSWDLSDSGFKEVRVWEWKFSSSKDRDNVIQKAKSAYDRLKLSNDHPCRKALAAEPQAPRKVQTPQPQQPQQPPQHQHTTTNGSSPPKKQRTVTSPNKSSPGTAGSGSGSSGAVKRKAASSATGAPAAKRMSLSNNDDLFELAQKFKKTYSEYARLYNVLSAEQNRKNNKAEVQRLLSMHRDLESWKKKLWEHTPPSQYNHKRATT